MNYFEMFSLAQQFQLDLNGLAARYRELQAQFHPDKFAAESAQSQAMAMQGAAQINDAYQTLKTPILRAQYLLSLVGVELQGEQQTVNDVEFLMLQMELREALEELGSASDPEQAIEQLAGRLQRDIATLYAEFEVLWQQQAWEAAADVVRKLKFYARLQQQLELREEQLLDY